MKKLIYCLLVSLFISSCCEKIPFDNDDKFWFENYSSNDSIVFESNNHDFDTLIISNVIIAEPDDGKCNLLVSPYIPAFARVDYSIIKDTFGLDQNYLVQFSQKPDNIKSLPVLRVFNMECHEYSGTDKKLIKVDYFLKSKNKLLLDCFIFDDRNCELNYGQYGIVEFVWSKKLGLISYKNKNGEVWEYLKIING